MKRKNSSCQQGQQESAISAKIESKVFTHKCV